MVMVAFNALYVTAEFATVGSRRSRLQEMADAGSRSADYLVKIMRDTSRLDAYVAACQVGITLSSLVAGAYGQAQLTPVFERVLNPIGARTAAVVVVLIIITTLQVVLGELLPKTVALRYPERLALAVVTPMRISQILFFPLVAIFNGSAFRLMKMVGLNADHSHAHVHSPEELAGLYRDSAEGGLIEASERDMLAGILNVDHRVVREIMTPRHRMVTVDADMTVRDALAAVSDQPHTRYPVVTDQGDIDAVVHLRELFVSAETDPSQHVGDIAEPVIVIPEVVGVPHLWRTLRDQDQHCALIVDEYGDVSGLVTLEDGIEEILGELQDEFDNEEDLITTVAGRISVRGDALVDVLEDRFGFDIAVDDVDTIGGWLWHHLGRTPAVGDIVHPNPDSPRFRVDRMDGRAVARTSFPESDLR